jgi:hypothetical protein
VGADTAGHVARNAVTAAADTRASFPHTWALNTMQGSQGTAAQAMPGQTGTRRFLHSAGRTMAFGGTGNVAMPYTGATPPAARFEDGTQDDNPGPAPGEALL